MSSEESTDELCGAIVCERYKLIKEIGAGAFGRIFLGTDLKNGNASILYFTREKKKLKKNKAR